MKSMMFGPGGGPISHQQTNTSLQRLCGAQVLARLLHHAMETFHLPLSDVFAWTDSTVVLGWLSGNPRRLKTYVGNRVSLIVGQIPPNRWNHVPGSDNPADVASRGLFPSELLEFELWWSGPVWLRSPPSDWPKQHNIHVEVIPEEEREICLVNVTHPREPILPLDRYSSFTRLQRVTAWALRFITNCRRSLHQHHG